MDSYKLLDDLFRLVVLIDKYIILSVFNLV